MSGAVGMAVIYGLLICRVDKRQRWCWLMHFVPSRSSLYCWFFRTMIGWMENENSNGWQRVQHHTFFICIWILIYSVYISALINLLTSFVRSFVRLLCHSSLWRQRHTMGSEQVECGNQFNTQFYRWWPTELRWCFYFGHHTVLVIRIFGNFTFSPLHLDQKYSWGLFFLFSLHVSLLSYVFIFYFFLIKFIFSFNFNLWL